MLRADVPRPVRFEFSLTNFEPDPHTYFSKEFFINFYHKENKFFPEYFHALKENGFVKQDMKPDYGTMKGHLGRRIEAYSITMWLSFGGREIADVLEEIKIGIPNVGISRTLKRKDYHEIIRVLKINGLYKDSVFQIISDKT